MIIDIHTRTIPGGEVRHEEAASHAATQIEKACPMHNILSNHFTLHADNGSPMKGTPSVGKFTLFRQWLDQHTPALG